MLCENELKTILDLKLNSRPLPVGLDGHTWDLHSSDKGADAQVVMQTLAADHVV